MGHVSDGDEGFKVFSKALMCLIFQDEGNVDEKNDALISAVKCVRIVDQQSFSMTMDYGDSVSPTGAGIVGEQAFQVERERKRLIDF